MADLDVDTARWVANLQDERDSAALYRRLADAEPDQALASVCRRLAEVEERHAELWAAAVTSAVVSTLGLFGIGALITLMTGRGVLFSGGRQVLIGLAAAGLTFGIGALIGGVVG